MTLILTKNRPFAKEMPTLYGLVTVLITYAYYTVTRQIHIFMIYSLFLVSKNAEICLRFKATILKRLAPVYAFGFLFLDTNVRNGDAFP